MEDCGSYRYIHTAVSLIERYPGLLSGPWGTEGSIESGKSIAFKAYFYYSPLESPIQPESRLVVKHHSCTGCN